MMDTIKKTFALKGIAVSPGVVIGKAYLFDRLDAQISFYKLSDPSLVTKEIKRLRTALRESEKQLIEIKEKLSHLKVNEPLYIIDVHIMILRDRRFIRHTIRYIRKMGVNAEWAIRMTIDKYREIFDRFEDEYLKGRFSDIRYVGQMVHLLGSIPR
jgi:phosphotransferase system enzyme I (PtsI)